MADPLGVSFSPTGAGGPNAQRPSPVQQAIQTLSLRIPSHAGASAFTPQSLLQAPGGSAFGGGGGNTDALLEMLKKLLFGGGPGQPGGMPGGMPNLTTSGGSFPPPGLTPGATPDGPIPDQPTPRTGSGPLPMPVPSKGPISTEPVPFPSDGGSDSGGADGGGLSNDWPVPGGDYTTGPSETSFPMPTMRRGIRP
jgi:hypothetical protein